MTDLEINKALALAIGWSIIEFSVANEKHLYIDTAISEDWPNYKFSLFDYKDPAVIWPIAKQYDLFPTKRVDGKWIANLFNMPITDTPEKAVALAVIERQKK